ncbi:MAG: 23S rRNA (adenine(2503)-C(2))-methyltransferase RlmN [Bacteroidaceae bacterium]|nr:23S rRNA (adenine(2503)-C(2))-methyltransferase RlmN [Bacteroidaceae bacterium]MBR1788308.1 23S rRNA (adenine(2503)-C(2))-methyltransferase RlmN [Bacteroidaceae bacterium]
MKTLLGKTLDELREVTAQCNLPSFAARQMAEWLYKHGVTAIDDMTNLSKQGRERLKQDYEVGIRPAAMCQTSKDGTRKYLFPTSDGHHVESVFIPDGDRATLCVSSQVGCKMGCQFCMTGRQGFEGQLSAGDILNQIYALPERDRLTNIVFMGQGEPFDNLDAVLCATQLLMAPYGWAWSPRRITVSTVGLRKGMERFLRESPCHLAVSLHSPFHEERAGMMPAERAWSLTEFLPLLQKEDWSGQRRLSFEYIVFGGLNDSEAHMRELVRLLSPMECRVNLIRFHTIPDTPFHGAEEESMTRMRDYLTRHGVTCTIRASRGQDIMAACGLLSTAKKE